MNEQTINKLTEYAKHVGLDQYGIDWVNNVVGAKLKDCDPPTEEVEHIIDFLASEAAPKRISKMSYDQAKNSAEKWMKTQIKKGSKIKELEGDTETVLDFGDGFRVVKLVGENAYKREGFLMRHCVASYYGKDVEVYSLRDYKNMPHCTMEKDQQIKGKGNGDIHPRYISYIIKFLEHIGMTVGDSEMCHLGYINVEEFKEELSSQLLNGKYHPRRQKLFAKNGKEFVDYRLWDKIPLVEFSSKTSARMNYDLDIFLQKATEKNIKFVKNQKKSKEFARIGSSGYSAKIGSSGYYSQIGSSGYSAQIGSSGGSNRIGSAGELAKIGSSGEFTRIGSAGNHAQIGSSGGSNRIGSAGECAQIGSSGYSAQIGSSGSHAKIVSTGEFAQIGSTGDFAKIGSSGDFAQIGSSGDSARIGSAGELAKIGSSGDFAQVSLEGSHSVVMCAGAESIIKGKKGCWITLAEWVEKDDCHIPACVKSAQIDGKILKEDTWYTLKNGKFVEVKEFN